MPGSCFKQCFICIFLCGGPSPYESFLLWQSLTWAVIPCIHTYFISFIFPCGLIFLSFTFSDTGPSFIFIHILSKWGGAVVQQHSGQRGISWKRLVGTDVHCNWMWHIFVRGQASQGIHLNGCFNQSNQCYTKATGIHFLNPCNFNSHSTHSIMQSRSLEGKPCISVLR